MSLLPTSAISELYNLHDFLNLTELHYLSLQGEELDLHWSLRSLQALPLHVFKIFL